MGHLVQYHQVTATINSIAFSIYILEQRKHSDKGRFPHITNSLRFETRIKVLVPHYVGAFYIAHTPKRLWDRTANTPRINKKTYMILLHKSCFLRHWLKRVNFSSSYTLQPCASNAHNSALWSSVVSNLPKQTNVLHHEKFRSISSLEDEGNMFPKMQVLPTSAQISKTNMDTV